MQHILITLLLFFVGIPALPQILTLDDCIKIAIENSYGIKIAKNEEAINKIRYQSYSVFLPSLYGDANQRNNYTNSYRKDASGTERTFDNVNAMNFSVGVSLNWRIFDGLSMFFTHSKNKELMNIGELNTTLTIEELVASISAAYYNVWIQTKLYEASKNILDISRERFKIATAKYTIGSLSGLEMRQSRIDLNTDSSQVIVQQQVLSNAYTKLNTLMNYDLLQTDYVQDTIMLMPLFAQSEITEKALAQNTSLLIAKKDINVAALSLKNSLSQFFPTIDFNPGYQYTYANTPASVTVLNRSSGFYWGFTARIPIFSKMENLQQQKIAKISLKTSELSYQAMETSVLGSLAELYNIYKTNHVLLDFEAQNVGITTETLELAIAKYRIGTLSGIEFREFQRSYIEAVKRLMNTSYQAKVSEINLQLLSGQLRFE